MWSLHNHSHGRQLQMQSILFLLLLLVSMLTSFQFSQTFIHHRRSSYVSSAYHHILHPIYRRTSPTTNAASASSQFDVGDDVIVVDDDGATFVSGRIEQKRGGWYTVLSMRDSKRLKRRGSQLQPNNKSTGSESVSSQQPLSNFVDSAGRNSEGNDEPLPEMQENIVDLDSILQLMQHSPQSIHQNNQTMSRETLDQIASCHSQYNQWIIFSDLHVMPSTLTTCLQVLDTVHEIANRTNSGIIFLGDWWHHRGFVRVDCLNAVLNALAKWTVPCIMIPGNHDQTDWAGLEHALTPLSNAYRIYPQKYEAGSNFNSSKQQHPGPLILSNPTKFLNALFIPHIRDKMMMNCILSSIEASSSSALFVHADVKGASMNDLIQSQHGLPASIFPNDKQIYSGHFHKPHRTQSIRYVGSPYQTSFAESGQVKSLLVVDSNRNWQCIEEIPIDIGPRYHRVSSIHRFLDYDGDHVRKGDKVSVTVDQFELEKMRLLAGENATNTGKKSLFDIRLEEFRKSGVVVEIRDRQPQEDVKVNAEKSTIDDENVIELENLSPKATLAAYLDDEVASGSLGETASEKLFETGVELIRNTTGLDTINGDSSIAMCPLSDALVSQLEIEAVSVRGFGSFRQEVVYPLSNRGLVLLRGTNKDGLGSDR
jgi:DNA repair exonuclease SbcCD nuclease subunit